MKRGDIWTVSAGSGDAGKPRPAVIVQDDSFDGTNSVTICSFTTDETDVPQARLAIVPTAENGLREVCRLMVDKLSTVPKSKVGSRIGRLGGRDIGRLDSAIVVFLGLTSARGSSD